MRFKLPNVFRNKKPETKLTGPSAADLLDAYYGKIDEPKLPYYNKREKSVQKYLEQLKVLVPDVYDYFQQQLDDSKSVHSGTFEDIRNFDKVIDKIEGTNLIGERVLVNTNLWKLNRAVKKLFNRTRIMADVGDAMLEYFGRELTQNLLAEDDIFSREDELLKKVPEWEETLNKCREEYGDSAFEANYRMGMLALLNDTLNHYDEVSDNPFEDYAEHKTQYNELLFKDIDALKARAKIFQNSCSEKAKLSANGYDLRNEMNRLDNAILMFEIKPDLYSKNHKNYTDEDAKNSFYEIAVIYTCLCKALNQAEHDELMGTIDKSVRADSEERLSSTPNTLSPAKEESKIESDELIGTQRKARINNELSQLGEEDYKEKIAEKKSAEEAFYYQLNLARKVRLITDDNWIEAMPIKECRTNATISMMKKAQATGGEIIVFPPLDDDRQKHNAFRVYTKNKMVRSTKLQPPFSIMQANRKKSVDFLVKIPEAYVEEFKNSLYQGGINAEMIEKNMCYTFDKETGIYNFFINKEKTSSYNPEEFKKRCTDANKAGIPLFGDIHDDNFKKPIYFGVSFLGNKDIISVLKDLYAYGVRYFLDYDSTTSVGNIYYDPSRENDVKEALQDYRYIDFRGDNEGDPHRADLRCDKESIENILKIGYIYDTGPDEPKGDREMD